MLPTVHFNDTGSATAGTIYGGAFLGPDTCQETSLAFFDIDRECELKDAVATLATGLPLAQGHAYLLSVNDVNAVIGVLLGSDCRPDVPNRSVPALKFHKGDRLFVRGVALTAVLEASVLTLRFGSKASQA